MYSPTKRTLNNKTSGSKMGYMYSPPRLNNNSSGNSNNTSPTGNANGKYFLQEQPLLVRNMYDQGNYYFYNNGYNTSPTAISNGGSPMAVYNPMLHGGNAHVSPTRKKKVGLNRNPRNNNVVMPSSPIKNNNLLSSSSASTTRHNVVSNNSTKKYKELKSVDNLERKPCNYECANLKNRYFGAVEPLQEESERKPNVNISYKNSKNKQKRQPVVYKISTPIAWSSNDQITTPDTSYLLPDKENYYTVQPIKFLHSQKLPHFVKLHDISTELLDESLTKKKPKHLQSIGNTTQNDSFDLSFDGKALDRSDILRMVDSFSVAFSDDEDNEDSFIARNSNDILPAEMTNNR